MCVYLSLPPLRLALCCANLHKFDRYLLWVSYLKKSGSYVALESYPVAGYYPNSPILFRLPNTRAMSRIAVFFRYDLLKSFSY